MREQRFETIGAGDFSSNIGKQESNSFDLEKNKEKISNLKRLIKIEKNKGKKANLEGDLRKLQEKADSFEKKGESADLSASKSKEKDKGITWGKKRKKTKIGADAVENNKIQDVNIKIEKANNSKHNFVVPEREVNVDIDKMDFLELKHEREMLDYKISNTENEIRLDPSLSKNKETLDDYKKIKDKMDKRYKEIEPKYVNDSDKVEEKTEKENREINAEMEELGKKISPELMQEAILENEKAMVEKNEGEKNRGSQLTLEKSFEKYEEDERLKKFQTREPAPEEKDKLDELLKEDFKKEEPVKNIHEEIFENVPSDVKEQWRERAIDKEAERLGIEKDKRIIELEKKLAETENRLEEEIEKNTSLQEKKGIVAFLKKNKKNILILSGLVGASAATGGLAGAGFALGSAGVGELVRRKIERDEKDKVLSDEEKKKIIKKVKAKAEGENFNIINDTKEEESVNENVEAVNVAEVVKLAQTNDSELINRFKSDPEFLDKTIKAFKTKLSIFAFTKKKRDINAVYKQLTGLQKEIKEQEKPENIASQDIESAVKKHNKIINELKEGFQEGEISGEIIYETADLFKYWIEDELAGTGDAQTAVWKKIHDIDPEIQARMINSMLEYAMMNNKDNKEALEKVKYLTMKNNLDNILGISEEARKWLMGEKGEVKEAKKEYVLGIEIKELPEVKKMTTEEMHLVMRQISNALNKMAEGLNEREFNILKETNKEYKKLYNYIQYVLTKQWIIRNKEEEIKKPDNEPPKPPDSPEGLTVGVVTGSEKNKALKTEKEKKDIPNNMWEMTDEEYTKSGFPGQAGGSALTKSQRIRDVKLEFEKSLSESNTKLSEKDRKGFVNNRWDGVEWDLNKMAVEEMTDKEITEAHKKGISLLDKISKDEWDGIAEKKRLEKVLGLDLEKEKQSPKMEKQKNEKIRYSELMNENTPMYIQTKIPTGLEYLGIKEDGKNGEAYRHWNINGWDKVGIQFKEAKRNELLVYQDGQNLIIGFRKESSLDARYIDRRDAVGVIMYKLSEEKMKKVWDKLKKNPSDAYDLIDPELIKLIGLPSDLKINLQKESKEYVK